MTILFPLDFHGSVNPNVVKKITPIKWQDSWAKMTSHRKS